MRVKIILSLRVLKEDRSRTLTQKEEVENEMLMVQVEFNKGRKGRSIDKM